jgi:hypothetical protein
VQLLVLIKKILKIKKARGALDIGHAAVKPGITTDEIDKIVH